jgi:hypothetical protein
MIVNSFLKPNVQRLLKIGDLWQGGIIVHLTGTYPNQGGLIASLDLISSGQIWGQNIASPTTLAYGSGYTNTQAAITNGVTTGAIWDCWNYTSSGYSDWFLPSLDELNFVIIAGAFLPYFVGGATYWSSSSYSANPTAAAHIELGNQTQTTGFKDASLFTIACRYF